MLSREWTKSTYSDSSANCLEVRRIGVVIEVRNSRDPNGPVVKFTMGEWQAFLGGAEDGEFNIA